MQKGGLVLARFEGVGHRLHHGQRKALGDQRVGRTGLRTAGCRQVDHVIGERHIRATHVGRRLHVGVDTAGQSAAADQAGDARGQRASICAVQRDPVADRDVQAVGRGGREHRGRRR